MAYHAGDCVTGIQYDPSTGQIFGNFPADGLTGPITMSVVSYGTRGDLKDAKVILGPRQMDSRGYQRNEIINFGKITDLPDGADIVCAKGVTLNRLAVMIRTYDNDKNIIGETVCDFAPSGKDAQDIEIRALRKAKTDGASGSTDSKPADTEKKKGRNWLTLWVWLIAILFLIGAGVLATRLYHSNMLKATVPPNSAASVATKSSNGDSIAFTNAIVAEIDNNSSITGCSNVSCVQRYRLPGPLSGNDNTLTENSSVRLTMSNSKITGCVNVGCIQLITLAKPQWESDTNVLTVEDLNKTVSPPPAQSSANTSAGSSGAPEVTHYSGWLWGYDATATPVYQQNQWVIVKDSRFHMLGISCFYHHVTCGGGSRHH